MAEALDWLQQLLGGAPQPRGAMPPLTGGEDERPDALQALQGALGAQRSPEIPGVPGVARPLLDAVASGEAPGYNIRYDGGKGSTFDSFDDHPRQLERITAGPYRGKFSDAAGRYQLISKTWDPLARQYGLPDFSPENQDFAAWQLANDSYRRMSRGQDLTEALQAGRYDDIASALAPEWASIGRNPNDFVSTLRKLSAPAGS